MNNNMIKQYVPTSIHTYNLYVEHESSTIISLLLWEIIFPSVSVDFYVVHGICIDANKIPYTRTNI